MPRVRNVILLVSLAGALASGGCSSEGSDAATTTASVPPAPTTTVAPATIPSSTTTTVPATVGVPVPDALMTDLTGSVVLTGYLVIDQGSPRLCAELLPLDPPACGGLSINVGGPVDTPLLSDAGTGVRWSPFPVDLAGSFSGSKLFADGPPPQLAPPPTTEAASVP